MTEKLTPTPPPMPEALRLADELMLVSEWGQRDPYREAAETIRAQHSRITALESAINNALIALRVSAPEYDLDDVEDILRTALDSTQ